MTHSVGPRALALIKTFEGCKLAAYCCPAGIWTIGWGDTGDHVKAGVIWTQPDADAALLARIDREFAPGVERVIGDAPTTPAQFGAMVALAYNIGVGAFSKSSVAKFHRAGQPKAAANAFGMWNRAGGKVLAGLTRRREGEAALYRGDYKALAEHTHGAVA